MPNSPSRVHESRPAIPKHRSSPTHQRRERALLAPIPKGHQVRLSRRRANTSPRDSSQPQTLSGKRSSLQNDAITDPAETNSRIGVPSRGAADIGCKSTVMFAPSVEVPSATPTTTPEPDGYIEASSRPEQMVSIKVLSRHRQR